MKHFLNKKITYDGIEIIDLFHRIKFIDKMKRDGKFFFEYYIKEGETPELLAKNIYGSEEWWWLILIYNDIQDPWFDWPISTASVEEYTKKIVTDWETNPDGYALQLSAEITANDEKRFINLLRPEYLPIVIKGMLGIK